MTTNSTNGYNSTAGLESNLYAKKAAETSDSKKSDMDPNDLANKEVFLQLLIAQIKNQDPSKPADSIQYLTQLSQFTGVEQMVDMKKELRTIREALVPAAAGDSKS